MKKGMPSEIINRKAINNIPPVSYANEDVLSFARQLLGKNIVTYIDGVLTSGRIVETEAYKGPEDKASHAYGNKRTQRTEVMFWEGGHAYVYLCYGIHSLFNVVCGQTGVPHAVLIRAIEPVEQIDMMLKRRKMTHLHRRLTAGPGVLAKALGINTSFSGLDMRQEGSHVWIEKGNLRVDESDIISSARVGVAYAEEWALLPWRFRVKDSILTSPAK